MRGTPRLPTPGGRQSRGCGSTLGRSPRSRRLPAQQQHRGAPPEARAATARLQNPDTVAIVTGQQAGAFGGPLFTLLKALTAIQLARRTSTEHGVDAVAIFWVDAEDHDWEEVRGVTVLDAQFHPKTIELDPPEGAGHLPIASVTLDARHPADRRAPGRAGPHRLHGPDHGGPDARPGGPASAWHPRSHGGSKACWDRSV